MPLVRRRSATGWRRPERSNACGPTRAGGSRRPRVRWPRRDSAPISDGCSSSSRTASSSATRSAPGRRELEVLGEDLVAVQGGDEAVDLVLHVGADQDVEVLEHGLRAAIESLVEPVDHVLAIAPATVPLALGAPKRHVPLPVAGGGPIRGINQVGTALGTDMKVASAAARRGRLPGLEDTGLEP